MPTENKNFPLRTYRTDYRSPAYSIDQVELCFDLGVPVTRVTAILSFSRNQEEEGNALVLNGERLRLVSVSMDGEELPENAYSVDDRTLSLHRPPVKGKITIQTELRPADNPGLEGLNHAGGVFFTHCEPQGFRHITYFPDRPDVLARYRCTLIADAQAYPTLLSNGHVYETGALEDGRHFASWEDPFPKASYLFALVAGRFATMSEKFITCSGREVALTVYAQPEDLPYCRHGLVVLKQAMEWDESTYDREYDLDVLNIVVMRSYPGGAMENKGLNLYTTEAFLASIDIVRDDVLRRVQAVVAHEYFHNWSGNRVGCRDWFELSLKEGFTIFRHQQFMATLVGKDVARIDQVIRLREYQFPEDEGGMAHAVRPSSYLAINNFYTCTVYEKGAELIRMMKLIVGEEVFRRAAVKFFTRFDGRAVTIDEMIDTVAEIAGQDLTQFRRWYDVIGGLAVYVDGEYDAVAHRYTLHIRQQIDDPAIPALHLPMRMGLLGPGGKALKLQLVGESGRSDYDRVIELRSDVQTLVFENVPAEPVPSLFRGFSAPVRLFIDRDEDELVLLATHDGDVVNRWDAAQQLAIRVMLEPSPQKKADLLDSWRVVFSKTLENAADNLGVAGRVLQLPSERCIGQQQAKLDVDGIHASRISLAGETAQRFRRQLRRLYRTLTPAAKEADALEARRMRNLCLWYLMQQPEEKDRVLCLSQFAEACCMEDRCAALQLLVDHGGSARSEALQQAYDWWQTTPSMLDQWFAIQAASEASDCVNLVERLTHHPDYSLENATRLKAIFDVFTANQSGLHHHSGEGYRVIVRLVLALNRSNPRLGARFLKRLDGWRRLDGKRRRMVSESLTRVLETPELAPDLYEIASQSLDQGAQH